MYELCEIFFEHYFNCYYWERKVTAMILSIAAAIGCYFGSTIGAGYSTINAVIICIAGFIVMNFTSYMLMSESFWRSPCEYFHFTSKVIPLNNND